MTVAFYKATVIFSYFILHGRFCFSGVIFIWMVFQERASSRKTEAG